MSRLAALGGPRPPSRQSLPRWKLMFKVIFFGGLGICLLLGWLSYSGFFGRTHQALVHRYERYQLALGFQVKTIVIKGRKIIPQQDILNSLGVQLGDPLSRFDLETAYNHLAHHPWIKSVIVQRQWPDGIHVLVQERLPLALWQYHQKVVLVDEEGIVLPAPLDSYKDLPLIIGPGAPEKAHDLLKLLKKSPVLEQEVVAATRIGNRRWDLRLKKGVTVMLPEDGYEQSLKTLEGLQKKIQIFEKAKHVIDLRLPKKMVMR